MARPLPKSAPQDKRKGAKCASIRRARQRQLVFARFVAKAMPMPQPSFLSASLLVASGGAFGSWLRFVVGRGWTAALGPVRAGAFPYATLTVNLAGGLLMGLLAGWLARSGPAQGLGSEGTRLLLAVGVLGGFTTFSAFSLDTVTLIERGQSGVALLYVGASVIAGIGALFAGLVASRSFA